MIKYVEFRGFEDGGKIHKFGRIILKNGKLQAEGDKVLKNILNRPARDLRPDRDQSWVNSKKNPSLFLRVLPYYYSGSRLTASVVQEAE